MHILPSTARSRLMITHSTPISWAPPAQPGVGPQMVCPAFQVRIRAGGDFCPRLLYVDDPGVVIDHAKAPYAFDAFDNVLLNQVEYVLPWL